MADKSPEKEEKKLTDISGSEGAEGERVEEKQNPPSQSQTGAGDTADDIKVKSEVTKWSIRQKIWDHMEKNDLVKFPRPVHHRIPNFEGAAVAGEKAATLDVFKKAQVIKINPDKPQENCRFLTLEANKTLLVPTPRLRSGLFNKIVPPDGCNKETLRICARSQGVKEYSTPIGLDAKVNVDLVIVGSVAVSEQGYRIGKGEGFADLEFAMMATMGAVGPDTIIVTTVHDCQVTEIPKDLVEDHDLTVDYIVTPTRIIECPNHPKPSGVIWSKLDPDKLERVPVLKKLRIIEKEAGKDTTIKEAPKDEEHADGVDNGPRQDRRRPRRRPRRISGRGEVGAVNSEEAPNEERAQRKPRRQRRPPRNRKNTSEDAQESGENVKEEMHNENAQPRHSGDEAQPRPRRRRFRQRRRNRDSGSGDQHDENEENEEREQLPQRRMRRRRRGPPRESEGENEGEELSRRRPQQRRDQGSRSPGADESGDDARRERRRRVMRNRLPALFVGSIPRSLRVSEFKANVRDKDVDPIRVIWHGNNGHAFLVFEEKEQIDSALDALKGLNINGRDLRVEVANQSQK